jgi:bacillolysin
VKDEYQSFKSGGIDVIEPTNKQKKALESLREVDKNVKVRWSKKTGSPARLRGNLSSPEKGDPEEIAKKFLTEHNELFALETPRKEVELKEINTDSENNQHLKFRQLYKGVPVFGRQVIVHMDNENAIKGVNGKIVRKQQIDLPIKPEISAEEAFKIVMKDDPANKELNDATPQLQILYHDQKSNLTWHVTVKGTDKGLYNQKIAAVWEYFVDALVGKVIWRYNNLQSQNITKGSGKGFYSGTVKLNTLRNQNDNSYLLEDHSIFKGTLIYTHDARGKNLAHEQAPVSIDNNNQWDATTQRSEVDCHNFTRKVYDYYLSKHGRNSYDNNGSTMHIVAHYTDPEDGPLNAFWNPNEKIVLVGDGDDINVKPLCALDVLAHEWTHAVTQHTAGLKYYGEYGALNEAISDIFGALIDNDWLMGEDIWLYKSESPAMRNMADPTNGGKYNPQEPRNSVGKGHQPDHVKDKFTGTEDGGGVHYNSGIMNKAAYLVSTGGSHRGIKICKGLGKNMTGKLYYHALTHHLTPTSGFTAMREALLDSLEDIYQNHPNYDKWRASIKNAFAAVGVGEPVDCN